MGRGALRRFRADSAEKLVAPVISRGADSAPQRATMRPLTDAERIRLQTWAKRRTSPYRLVTRARIVLLAAAGRSQREIAARLHVRPTTVTRWLRRYALLGSEGLVHDAPRPLGRTQLPDATVRAILWKTLREKPPNARHWTTRALARATGVSHTSVRRIWHRFGVRSNMSRVSELARWGRAPDSLDVSGVFFDPPWWAVVFTASPRVRGPGNGDAASGSDRQPPVAELFARMDRMRRNRPGGARRTLVDQEFLAFLGRVAHEHRPLERIQLVAGSDGDFSGSIARWLKTHPEISVLRRVGSDHRPLAWPTPVLVVEGPARAPPGLPSLPRVRSELESWFASPAGAREPFAWLRS